MLVNSQMLFPAEAAVLLIFSVVIGVVVASPVKRAGGTSSEEETTLCYKACVTDADLSLWPTTPPAEDDDEEPRCRADIRFTADCMYQCEDLSIFACAASTLKMTAEKLKKVLEAISMAKYCQGCRFFDNENCPLPEKARQQLNISMPTRHPHMAALSPFVNGLYLMDNAVCRSESKSVRDVLTEANVLESFCEWIRCESVAIQTAPGCFDVAKHLRAIVNTYSSYLQCHKQSQKRSS